jgi:hypothetical protein
LDTCREDDKVQHDPGEASMTDDLARGNISLAGAKNSSTPRSLKERMKDEFVRFIVLFFYLWVLFGVFVIIQDIILRQEGRPLGSQGFAFINALVLAKVMLVFEDLDLGRWLERRPLIYPILFETSVLTVLFLCFHVVEKTIEGLFRGETIAASLPKIGGGGLVGLTSVAVILFVALIPFFAFRNLKRALGANRMNELVFGASAKGEA